MTESTAGEGEHGGARVSAPGRKGRAEIIKALACRYGKALHLFFSKRGLSSTEAEDLTQEVYVRLARMDDVAASQKAEPLLFQTAANLLRDKARRARARRTDHRFSLEDCELTAEVSSPIRVLQGKQSLERVFRVLSQLTVRQRDVFVLHRFEEMTYSQIAAHLGISVGAVEKHMMKVIARIHQHLEDG